MVSNKNKRKGFFCKRLREWKGSLKNRGKGRGFLANVPSFFLLTRTTEEGVLGAGGGPRRRPRARRRPGSGGKEGGRPVGSIPPSISGKEACRDGSHGGGQQQTAAAVVAPLRGSTAARSWGKRGREPWGFHCLPWLGLGRSEEGSSAVAGALEAAAMVVAVLGSRRGS